MFNDLGQNLNNFNIDRYDELEDLGIGNIGSEPQFVEDNQIKLKHYNIEGQEGELNVRGQQDDSAAIS